MSETLLAELSDDPSENSYKSEKSYEYDLSPESDIYTTDSETETQKVEPIKIDITAFVAEMMRLKKRYDEGQKTFNMTTKICIVRDEIDKGEIVDMVLIYYLTIDHVTNLREPPTITEPKIYDALRDVTQMVAKTLNMTFEPSSLSFFNNYNDVYRIVIKIDIVNNDQFRNMNCNFVHVN